MWEELVQKLALVRERLETFTKCMRGFGMLEDPMLSQQMLQTFPSCPDRPRAYTCMTSPNDVTRALAKRSYTVCGEKNVMPNLNHSLDERSCLLLRD